MEILKGLLVVWMSCLTSGLEVGVPERFLRPRNFNPHPYTNSLAVEAGAALPDVHPYHLFERPALRGEDSSAPVQFPKVPDVAATTRSPPRLKPDDVKHPLSFSGYQVQPKIARPLPVSPNGKNYAFSYSVLDHHSGDDFSHSQAHTGDATKGEYRVKLPDGRTQVVSYTADSRGYRADVRYDNEITDYRQVYKPATYKQASSYKDIYKSSTPQYKSLYKPAPQVYYQPTGDENYPDYQEYAAPKQFTPIHEDYPDNAPQEASAFGPSEVPQASYYGPSTPRYNLASASSPSPSKFYVLPAHIKQYK